MLFQNDAMGCDGQEEVSIHWRLMETHFWGSVQGTSVIKASLPLCIQAQTEKHPTGSTRVPKLSHPSTLSSQGITSECYYILTKVQRARKAEVIRTVLLWNREKPTETRHIFKGDAISGTLQG